MFFPVALLSSLLALAGVGSAAPAAVHKGDGTFYAPGLGACGLTNSASDHIAAVSHQFFDSYEGGSANPNKNKICGKTATVHSGGKSVTVKIVDRCGGCKGPTDLDMSPSAFDVLAPESKGRIPITWTLN